MQIEQNVANFSQHPLPKLNTIPISQIQSNGNIF